MDKHNKDTVKECLAYLGRYYKFTLDELTGQFFYQRRDCRTKKKLFDRGYFVRFLSESKFKYSSSTVRESLKAIHYKPINAVKAFFGQQKYLNHTCSPFDQLDDYFTLDEPAPYSFASMLEMHLVRAIRSVINGEPNRFIFTLVSAKEYLGKTSFIEWLFPSELQGYCMSTLGGRKERRDTILASKFLVNIDEFSGATVTADAQLKAMVSQRSAALWIPFKNQIEQRPRITTFFATKNLGKKPILSDKSSNSRYIIYNVQSIDWSYRDKIDASDLWSYAIAKALDPTYDAELGIDEVRDLEAYNKRYSDPVTPTKVKSKRQSSVSKTSLAAAVTAAITAFAFTPWGRVLISAAAAIARSFVSG